MVRVRIIFWEDVKVVKAMVSDRSWVRFRVTIFQDVPEVDNMVEKEVDVWSDLGV